MQRRQIILAGVVTVLIVVVFIVAKSGGGGSNDVGPANQPPLQVIHVNKDAKADGGILDAEYTQGQKINVKVTSEIPGEVHFHGYNVMKTVKKPGGSVTFNVPATIQGVFEMEMEEQHSQIAQITVDPG
jgi:hypothetical protein